MTRPLCVLPLMFGFRLLLPGQVTVANPSFETPSVDGPCPKFLYDPKGASWTVTGITTAGCAAGFNAPVRSLAEVFRWPSSSPAAILES